MVVPPLIVGWVVTFGPTGTVAVADATSYAMRLFRRIAVLVKRLDGKVTGACDAGLPHAARNLVTALDAVMHQRHFATHLTLHDADRSVMLPPTDTVAGDTLAGVVISRRDRLATAVPLVLSGHSTHAVRRCFAVRRQRPARWRRKGRRAVASGSQALV